MAFIADHNRGVGHFVKGTKGADTVEGNGTMASIILGDGDDRGNQGIVVPGQTQYTFIYGGVLNHANPLHPGVTPPAWAVKGNPTSIGGADFDGNDRIDIGWGGWAAPGSTSRDWKPGEMGNLVVIHGPAPKQGLIAHVEADMTTDRLLMDHSKFSFGAYDDGFVFEDIRKHATWTEGGRKFVEVKDFVAHTQSLNPRVEEEFALIDVSHDFRGIPDHHPLVVEWTGGGWRDDVSRELHSRVVDDHGPAPHDAFFL